VRQLASLWRAAAVVAAKDLRLERRGRTRLAAIFALAVLLLLLFAFALDPATSPRQVGAVILWVPVLFAGLLAVGRAFAQEREEDALTALRLAPVPGAALYLGKLLANLAVVAGLQALVLALGGLFFGLGAGAHWGALLLLLGVGSLAFLALATLLAAVTAPLRLGETLLPVLLLPLLFPVVIFAAAGTQRLLLGRPLAEVRGPLQLLLAFALVYLAAGCLLTGPALEEE